MILITLCLAFMSASFATTLELDYIRLKSKPLEHKRWDSTVRLCRMTKWSLLDSYWHISLRHHYALPGPYCFTAPGALRLMDQSWITFHDFVGLKIMGQKWEMVMKTVMGVGDCSKIYCLGSFRYFKELSSWEMSLKTWMSATCRFRLKSYKSEVGISYNDPEIYRIE